MKKLKSLKTKILMFILALILPLTASSIGLTINDYNIANAEEETSSYSMGRTKEISITNSNFNNVSTYSISTSLTGWQGLNNDKSTTAGIINTGNSFGTYMANTYRLAKNPNTKATDKHILMINSKTSNSTNSSTARQGYRSNSISLDANSFYSFQVSFKNDTNYDSETTYVKRGIILEEKNTAVSKSNFESVAFGENSFVQFNYDASTRFLPKRLTSAGVLGEEKTNVAFFYEDDEYYGFFKDVDKQQPVYVKKADVTERTETSNTLYDISSDVEIFTCNLTYKDNTQNYWANAGDDYFETKTIYNPVENTVFGSIYLSGLKDEEGNSIESNFVKVTSNDWVTFFFFVATGNEAQSVTLDLWLGASLYGMTSSGVVFYDDVHVYQYSENKFWETYERYYGKTYDLEIEDTEGNIQTQKIDCVNFVDLRNNQNLDFSSYNFDFEAGIFNDDTSSLKNWTSFGSQKAQIFNSYAPEQFKRVTGYNFVGSTLSSKAVVNEDQQVSITPNKYVLGLWADNDYVSVKSNAIAINANEIYKVTAYYKISAITSGNVYLQVEENDSVINAYQLSEADYTLAELTSSSGVTTNGSNEFNNNYGTIEFYIKGGPYFNSAVNLLLSLGKSDENATGCVVFDDIQIKKATTEQFTNATNKIELGQKERTTTITNGLFDNVTITENQTFPLAPQDWTITSEDGISFGGVINTETAQYQAYQKLYREENIDDVSNPYLWARYSNPGNSKNLSTDLRPDNILMLANFSNVTQTVTSGTFEVSANKAYDIKFYFKSYNKEEIKLTLLGTDGFTLYQKDNFTTNGQWQEFNIYLKSFAGKETLTLKIDFTGVGAVYFDNFSCNEIDTTLFEEKEQANNENLYGIVNMDDYYFNIPTSEITADFTTSYTPAYNGSLVSGTKEANQGKILKSEYFNGKQLAINEENKVVFFMFNQDVGSYRIESNYSFDLSSETKYYTLSFKVKTLFPSNDRDKSKTYENGLTIGLTGYEYINRLITTGDDYETYTMHFLADTDKTAKLYMSFVSDYAETIGSVAIYDINFSASDEETYNDATEIVGDKNYKLSDDKVFVAKADESTEEETPDNEETEEETPSTNFDWLYIPTLITALAIVIAIVGFAMRKVKIKKIERKRIESYDRKSSLHIDRIKNKAKQEQEKEINEINETKQKFEVELENLEKEHKQKVLTLREQDKNKVSKETDKEFKRFAQKRSVITEKITSLSKQIEDIKSAEHLLSLERKLFAQEEMKQKELKKLSLKENKTKDKENKK